MPFELTNFVNNHQISDQKSCVTQLPAREFKSLAGVLGIDYVVNLRENGFLSPNDGKLIELFSLFRAVTIEQITRFILPQYTNEGHQAVAELMAKLYYSYFVNIIDVENKLKNHPQPHPEQSFVFTLGPAGARYLAALKGTTNLVDVGWSKSNLLEDISYGVHNLIVTDIIVKLSNAFRMLGLLAKDVNTGLVISGEFEGLVKANVSGKQKVLARPDYTFQVKFNSDETRVTRTFWLEYDNGTEGLDVLIRKIDDYNLGCGAGHQVLGTPKQSIPIFIFNKTLRAQKFVKSLMTSTKEWSYITQPIYVTDLETIYEESMFTPQWYKIDLTLRNQDLSEQPNVVLDEDMECQVIKESIFPELFDVIQKKALLPVICPPAASLMDFNENAVIEQELAIFKRYFENNLNKPTPTEEKKSNKQGSKNNSPSLPLFDEDL